MNLHKLAVFAFAALLPMAPYVSGQTKASIDPAQVVKVHEVMRGETLWRIATNNALDGVSVWQLLISIYQMNLNAFVEKDISRLSAGSQLWLPSISQITSLSPAHAEAAFEQLISGSLVSLPALPAKALESVEITTETVTVHVSANIKEVEEVAEIVEVVEVVEVVAVKEVVVQKIEPAVSQKINPAPAEAPFILKKITIVGNESFSGETLHALVSGAEGTAQNITQLGQLAARITQFYQDQGYFIVRAILPAQPFSQGNVTIRVIEAKYGQVNLTNNSSVSDELLVATASTMQPGTVISDANMYTSLLLLSDVSGLVVSSSLSPGSKVGSSDVSIVLEDSQPYTASLLVDQHGDAYTGKERITGSVEVNNLAGHGDVLSVNGMLSSGDMQFGRLAYDWLFNGDGTHLGAAYSGLNYRLGKEFSSTQANGSSRTSSLWAKHPLLRSLDANLSVQLQYDVNQLKDHIDSSSLRTDRTIFATSLIITGDQKNTYNLGGISSWSLGLKSGDLRFDDSAAEIADASSAVTKGHFSKINLNLNHLQSVSDKASVYLTATGQWASHNLDSSDKLSAGGIGGVRAYGSGALTGDTGYVGSAEFRYYLTPAFDGSLTGSLFYDTAYVMVNKAPWPALTSANSATISGAGVALDWVGPNQASVRLVVAAPTGSASSLVTDRPSHTVWLNMKKGF